MTGVGYIVSVPLEKRRI